MKKLKAIIGCVLVAMVLTVASPALALSLGVSPSQIELEVPGNGSITTDVKIHYFDGDVQISLIDIPLRVEPETISVEASEEPVEVELTIYGDSSLGSQIYDGYIRFIAVSGGAATGGVQVIARITNLVDGETPVLATPEKSQLPQEEEEIVDTVLTEEEVITDEAVSQKEETETLEGKPFPIIPVAGIAAGTIIVITLIIVIARARRYQY